MVRGREWTGFEAVALQEAMRKSVREFAALLGIDITTITNWRTRLGSVKPRSNTQAILDTTHDQRASEEDRARFEQIVAESEEAWRERHGRPPGSDVTSPSVARAIADVNPSTSPVVFAGLNDDYVESLHGRIRQLLDVDATFGGDQSSGAAL